jgi:hypothetical protein
MMVVRLGQRIVSGATSAIAVSPWIDVPTESPPFASTKSGDLTVVSDRSEGEGLDLFDVGSVLLA